MFPHRKLLYAVQKLLYAQRKHVYSVREHKNHKEVKTFSSKKKPQNNSSYMLKVFVE